jgi:predicted regulator of Ras-like GTPase activity (Roadblock/LC7/MglB family)
MIRSCRIPPVLNRICDGDNIRSALLVTSDGELLGTSTTTPTNNNMTAESFGTLVADIAADYVRLGEEYAGIDGTEQRKSHMQCLLLELQDGLIGVASCSHDCLVVAVAAHDAPPGLIRARLVAASAFIQESFSTLSDGT